VKDEGKTRESQHKTTAAATAAAAAAAVAKCAD